MAPAIFKSINNTSLSTDIPINYAQQMEYVINVTNFINVTSVTHFTNFTNVTNVANVIDDMIFDIGNNSNTFNTSQIGYKDEKNPRESMKMSTENHAEHKDNTDATIFNTTKYDFFENNKRVSVREHPNNYDTSIDSNTPGFMINNSLDNKFWNMIDTDVMNDNFTPNPETSFFDSMYSSNTDTNNIMNADQTIGSTESSKFQLDEFRKLHPIEETYSTTFASNTSLLMFSSTTEQGMLSTEIGTGDDYDDPEFQLPLNKNFTEGICIFMLPLGQEQSRDIKNFVICVKTSEEHNKILFERLVPCLKEARVIPFVKRFVRVAPSHHLKCQNLKHNPHQSDNDTHPSKKSGGRTICQLQHEKGQTTQHYSLCALPVEVLIFENATEEELADLAHHYCHLPKLKGKGKYSIMDDGVSCNGVKVYDSVLYVEKKSSMYYASVAESCVCLFILVICCCVLVKETRKKFHPINVYFITITIFGSLSIVMTNIIMKENRLFVDAISENDYTCFLTMILGSGSDHYIMCIMALVAKERYHMIANPFSSVTANRSVRLCVMKIFLLLLLTLIISSINASWSIFLNIPCSLTVSAKSNTVRILISGSVIRIIFLICTTAFSVGTVWHVAVASLRRAQMGVANIHTDRNSYINLFLSSCCLIFLSIPEVASQCIIMANFKFYDQKLIDLSNDLLMISRPIFSTINCIIFLTGSGNIRRKVKHYLSKLCPSPSDLSGIG